MCSNNTILYILILTGERRDVAQAKTAAHDIWLPRMADPALFPLFDLWLYLTLHSLALRGENRWCIYPPGYV